MGGEDVLDVEEIEQWIGQHGVDVAAGLGV